VQHTRLPEKMQKEKSSLQILQISADEIYRNLAKVAKKKNPGLYPD
jgi:dTDP-D-glucose 4,6-dehydratase